MSMFSIHRRTLLRAAAAVMLTGALAACSDPAPTFRGNDISGTQLGQSLALEDHNGQARTLQDFEGKVVVAFFGFTQCPDICPTALAELSQTMQQLGPDADR